MESEKEEETLRIYERKSEFGWEGDNDLGTQLIQQIIEGTKTATCFPLFSYTEEELAAVFASKGEDTSMTTNTPPAEGKALPQKLYLIQVATLPPTNIPAVCYLIQTEDGRNILIDSGLSENVQPLQVIQHPFWAKT